MTAFLKWILRIGWLREMLLSWPFFVRWLSKTLIVKTLNMAKSHRPYPFALDAPYTTWRSLSNRSYTARQLPPRKMEDLPDINEVADLWRRQDNEFIPSTNTSIMFSFFAQWFTDSFLRTNLGDRRKNTSNHEIDFCQLYGLSEEKTDILRLKRNGKLRYQLISGRQYQPFLFASNITQERLQDYAPGPSPSIFNSSGQDEGSGYPDFSGLHELSKLKYLFAEVPDERLRQLLVTGLEHGNSSIGYTLLNTIFLREHNRVCDEILKESATLGLDKMSQAERDDFIFEKARLVLIVQLLKIVVGEYVPQLSGAPFPFQIDNSISKGAEWKNTNWISIEFNLLYRWHSLVPEVITLNDQELHSPDFRTNPAVVFGQLEDLLEATSEQRAGQIGLRNTHELFFGDSLESSIKMRSIKMARDADLQPMNAYRKQYSLKPFERFEEITDDRFIQQRLRELYGHPDNVELYVGLYAEQPLNKGGMLGELMRVMVAYDAFTHVLSNPILSERVYNEKTFTPVGMDIINATNTLSDVVNRNVDRPVHVSFDTQSTRRSNSMGGTRSG